MADTTKEQVKGSEVTKEEANALQKDITELQAKHGISLYPYIEYHAEGIIPRIGLVKTKEIPFQAEKATAEIVEETTGEVPTDGDQVTA